MNALESKSVDKLLTIWIKSQGKNIVAQQTLNCFNISDLELLAYITIPTIFNKNKQKTVLAAAATIPHAVASYRNLKNINY